jgi:hypothetical protein
VSRGPSRRRNPLSRLPSPRRRGMRRKLRLSEPPTAPTVLMVHRVAAMTVAALRRSTRRNPITVRRRAGTPRDGRRSSRRVTGTPRHPRRNRHRTGRRPRSTTRASPTRRIRRIRRLVHPHRRQVRPPTRPVAARARPTLRRTAESNGDFDGAAEHPNRDSERTGL